MNKSPLASIIIRTFNESAKIGAVLEAVYTQDLQDFEVIVVDSESTDETVKIAQTYPVKVVTLKQTEFTYGRGLNVGANNAQGEFLVFISGHSVPVDSSWLENLLSPFSSSLDIVGVCGRQIPFADARYYERWRLNQAFERVSGLMNLDSLVFSNANSALHRSAWLQMPFDEQAPYGEDLIWARGQIKSDKTIYFQYNAMVYHSHIFTHRQRVYRAREGYLFCIQHKDPTLHWIDKLPFFLAYPITWLQGVTRSVRHFTVYPEQVNLRNAWNYYLHIVAGLSARYSVNRNLDQRNL
ncbi:MAG: glycosyltransferase family 2 protein [Planctomycetes bacterium]|nr:glycosyltransferase family 2 protein [Planctomycetota bacterium]